MAKAKTGTVFFCKECGYESGKWMGQCPACKEWNTFVEEPVVSERRSQGAERVRVPGRGTAPVHISDISLEEQDRTATGFGELDRVLGSGIVRGSLVLVGGDPGIGKSTLLLQVCRNLSMVGKKVLYISGEESLKQIKMRANRIGTITGELLFLCETNLDLVRGAIENEKPDVVIIDSIQTMYRRIFPPPRKRQPGTGIHKPADADRQRAGDHHFHRGPCDQGGRGSRSQGPGAYGGYGAVF